MFCPNCGRELPDGARHCPNCGSAIGGGQVGGPAAGVNIPNYLVQAILVTVFCCLPFGIVSIVYAAQVNDKAGRGDVQGATTASENARKWAWVSFGAGIAAMVLWLLFAVAGGMLTGFE